MLNERQISGKNYVYVFVRRDLPPSTLCVQSGHAIYEAAVHRNPNLDHPHFVLIGVKNEQQLTKALDYVQNLGIKACPFYESDLCNELTAFATQPVFEDQRPLFRKYNCLNNSHFSGFTQNECNTSSNL